MKVLLSTLVALSLLFAGCGDDDDADDAFTFADDDVCEWVSEDEVAEFVAAEFDWDGTATQTSPNEFEACRWELSSASGASGSVAVLDGGLSVGFEGKPYDFDAVMAAQGVLDYRGPVGLGEFVAGHPELSDGVVVHNGGFGQFAFAVPPDTEWLLLDLQVPDQPSDDWVFYEPRFFAVADRFLDELGWLSAP